MIEINLLSKTTGIKKRIQPLTITLPSPGITLILGTQGCGKTTLLRLLLSLEAHEGTVTYSGAPFESMKGHIAAVYEDLPLYPHLTGLQNLELLVPHRMDTATLCHLCAAFLGPEELNQKVQRYSPSQRKVLSICMAFLSRPRVLCIDNFTAHLGDDTQHLLIQTLQDYRSDMAFILTGQPNDRFYELADRLLVLENGQFYEIEPSRSDQVHLGSV